MPLHQPPWFLVFDVTSVTPGLVVCDDDQRSAADQSGMAGHCQTCTELTYDLKDLKLADVSDASAAGG